MRLLRDAVYGLLQDTIQHKIVSKLLDNSLYKKDVRFYVVY